MAKSKIWSLAALWLGLTISSHRIDAQTSADQTLARPPKVPQVDENGVNLVTGRISYEKTFLSIGPDGAMGLEYKIMWANGSRNNFSNLMKSSTGQYTQYTASAQFGSMGSSSSDQTNLDGAYVGGYPDGNVYVMKDGTTAIYGLNWNFSYPDQTTVESFDLLTSIKYPNGVEWNLYYLKLNDVYGIPQVRLQSVTSNTGYQLHFTYKADNILTDKVNWLTTDKVTALNMAYEYCNPSAISCNLLLDWDSIQYTSPSSIMDPNGNLWQMSSSGSGSAQNLEFKSPLSTTAEVVYSQTWISQFDCGSSSWQPGDNPACQAATNDPTPHVSSATVNGVTRTYNYAEISNGTSWPTWRVTRSGPDGTAVFDSIKGHSGITKLTDVLNRVSQFTYDGTGRLLSAQFPEGNSVQYILDSRGNQIQTIVHGKNGGTISTYKNFPSCPLIPTKTCNQPTSITDARGNITTFTYDSVHGGVLTMTLPADADGIHPVTRYSYTQRYARVKNSTGTFVNAGAPIWLLTEERTCIKGATSGNTCALGASDEVVKQYDFGPNGNSPNNLLLRGVAVISGGVTLRTCYVYDKKGNRISETRPNANLGSCS